MSVNYNVVKNAQTVEYGKFVELDKTLFPSISVVRVQQWDTSDAFPENTNRPPLTTVDIYPKYGVLTHITNPDDIKVSLSAENLNVNLADVENILNVISPNVADIKTNTNDLEVLLSRSNTLLNVLTANTDELEVNTDGVEALLARTNTLLNANTGYALSTVTNTSDIEALINITNTLLTANSSNTSYLIPKAYTTVATTALTSKFFTNFGGVSGYLKNVKGINTTPDPSLPGTEVYLQIWSGDNNLTGVNSKLLFTYSVESESNFDIVFSDGIIVGPLWIVSSLTSITYTTAPDTLFLTITYTT